MKNKEQTEYTGVESSIDAAYKADDTDWIPLHKAMTLDNILNDEADQNEAMSLDQQKERLHDVLERMRNLKKDSRKYKKWLKKELAAEHAT